MEDEELPPRKNGCKCPFHPFQIIAYILFITKLVCFYMVIPIGLINSIPASTIFCILYFTCVLFVLYFTIVATKIDPTDPTVYVERAKRNNHESFASADFQFFCQICNTHVQSRTKHCGDCNRCVSKFDHHCKWLNNCVGEKNYKEFLYLCLSVFFLSLTHIITNAYFIVAYFVSDARDNLEDMYGASGALSLFIILCIVAAMNILTLGLISHLIILHMWLHSKGLTTYDYILILREEKDGKRKGKSRTINKIDRNEGEALKTGEKKANAMNEETGTEENGKTGEKKGGCLGLCRGKKSEVAGKESKETSEQKEREIPSVKLGGEQKKELAGPAKTTPLMDYAASTAQLMSKVTGCNADENVTAPEIQEPAELPQIKVESISVHNSPLLNKRSTIMAPGMDYKERLNRSEIVDKNEKALIDSKEPNSRNGIKRANSGTKDKRESSSHVEVAVGSKKILETLNKLDLKKNIEDESGDYNLSQMLESKGQDEVRNRKMVQGYNTYDHGSGSWVRTGKSPGSLQPNPKSAAGFIQQDKKFTSHEDRERQKNKLRSIIEGNRQMGRPECIEIEDEIDEMSESREDTFDLENPKTEEKLEEGKEEPEMFIESDFGDNQA